VRATPAAQLQASLLALAGAAMYRIDAFLVAFDPGPGWRYFPSLGELAVTLGLVATETMVYVAAVRTFPILAGVAEPARRPAPQGLQEGAAS
jgi:Ni/Fe-hydrogenase subunit HybB-like protein